MEAPSRGSCGLSAILWGWYHGQVMTRFEQKYRQILEAARDPKTLDSLSDQDKRALLEWLEHAQYSWELHARPEQRMPAGDWHTWLVLAGRGFGKTRVGSEAVRELVRDHRYRAVGLIAATASDARDTMIDGKGGSSLLEVTPQDEGLEYFPTKRRLNWKNGAVGTSFSAEEPQRLRGPQHDVLWSDELAAWRYLEETWDMAQFGLRLGKHPKHIITTTPRPLPILRELMQDAVPAREMRPGMKEKVVFTKGTTQDNKANLSPEFITDLMKRYEGTRLGRQEIYAEILDDNPNALFTQRDLDLSRVKKTRGYFKPGHEVHLEFDMPQGDERPQKFKITVDELVIAIDPSMSHDLESDETGIIVMAKDYASKKEDGNIYVLEDQSGIYSPNEWARLALNLYQKYNATCIVAEVNQGGDLVEHTIRTVEKEMDIGRVNYKQVRASKGKISRTEPVGALSEQHRLRHVGDLPKLEDQLISFAPGFQRSPDRLDAYVWGAHHLIVQRQKKSFYIF